MYCLYVGFDYTYIDVNALAQGIKSFLASLVCVFLCMYVCIDVCMYVCICVCVYVCVCMYVCVYVCVYVCMYVCLYVCVISTSSTILMLNTITFTRYFFGGLMNKFYVI